MRKLFPLILFASISVFSFGQGSTNDAYSGTATGTNSYSVTINSVTATSPYNFQKIWVKFTNPNSGASTLKLSGSGFSYSAIGITLNGSALVANDILAAKIYPLIYNTTSAKWELQKPSSAPSYPVSTANGGTGQDFSATEGLLYQNIANNFTHVTSNTSTTRKFLKQTGSIGVPGTPSFDTIRPSDIQYAAWMLNGNTNGAEKWLGTSDNFDLPFKTNNTEVARFTSGGYFHLGNTSRGQIDVSGSSTLLLSSISASIDIGLTNQVIGGLRGGNESGLDIRPYSAGTANVPLTFSAYSPTYGYVEYFNIKNVSSGYSDILFPSAAKVGIGTSSPTGKFQVNSSGTNSTTHAVQIYNGNGNIFDLRDDDQIFITGATSFYNRSNGDGITISTNDNVIDMYRGAGPRFQIRQDGNALVFNAISADRDYNFKTNGTSVQFIDGTNKRVGINTESPAYSMDIVGNLRATGSGIILTSSGGADMQIIAASGSDLRLNAGSSAYTFLATNAGTLAETITGTRTSTSTGRTTISSAGFTHTMTGGADFIITSETGDWNWDVNTNKFNLDIIGSSGNTTISSAGTIGITSTGNSSITAPSVNFTMGITNQDSLITDGDASVIADDGIIQIPDGKSGRGWVMLFDSGTADGVMFFRFDSNATVTELQVSDGVNSSTIDTDNKICIYDNGANVNIKNRLGGTRTIKLEIIY